MKVRALLLGLVAALPFALAPSASVGTAAEPPVQLEANDAQAQAAMWATRFLTRFHYKRVPLDDAMSAEILERYLEGLDGDKLFFLQSDIDTFARYKSTLDDSIYDQTLDPPFEIFRVYADRINQRTAHARGLLDKGFEFTTPETYSFDREDASWAANATDTSSMRMCGWMTRSRQARIAFFKWTNVISEGFS